MPNESLKAGPEITLALKWSRASAAKFAEARGRSAAIVAPMTGRLWLTRQPQPGKNGAKCSDEKQVQGLEFSYPQRCLLPPAV